MKVETIGKILIAAGVIILLYAISMPVSRGGSSIVNIHLISERQNTLLFGGLLFIAGIILFAVFKLKQTKADAETADTLRQERKDSVKSFMAGSDRGPLSVAVRLALGITFGAYSAFLLTQLILFIVAMSIESFSPEYVPKIVTGLIAIAFIVYAFRKISIKKVVIHFVILAASATVSIPVRSMLVGMESRACNNFYDDIRANGPKGSGSGLELANLWGRMAYCARLSAQSMD